ncbi:oxygen-independent coproporphyrinogen III oxidase [Achromobacter insolitus]|uniref:oxygen-independent coproporphyrinogen III oxidase n=1 Tax=Achromobacter insolitus TaxID=217204 RepID=UPI0005386EA3|nr:oxygen-independent coproporphyrinogen III oxidase [Achromobacter insolitus]AVG38576.1 oxygen-independent coproporphyrinogen III oxidase [Achromobacter insolitus]OAE72551.1 oxygen-independent coproporphyrinogen III oxidase [Achromobacter insolitus]OCZ55632.1 oxygen-independent coproporphyrinogen III oxidase [Achromobacter insolitus]
MQAALRPSQTEFRAPSSAGPLFPPQLLARLDKNGPRYTSYPTADRYHGGFGQQDYRLALQQRRAASQAEPVSLYVHIPFCESVCYYCACNKVVTRHHDRAARYLDALGAEIELHVAELGEGVPVSQLHFGGGTPTFLSDEELSRLMANLRRAFRFEPDAEISIEVDPRTATPARLAHMRELGFNRLSFGVQDFDPRVQAAVHRLQSFEDVRALMEGARALGYASVNMDLIYGLPLQTTESFARTISQVIALRPDRIALYAYAHLPARFKPQRRINEADLPDRETRVGLLSAAIDGFLKQGYAYIGMDHFALETDALAIAKQKGELHRNFQGYSTQPDRDLIALGVSAIGRIGNTYSQNAKVLDEYYAAIEAGRFAVERGLALNADDLVRREIIMDIMCQGRVDFARIEARHGLRFADSFGRELLQMANLAELGLVNLRSGELQVTGLGWYFVRAVAMVFDGYLQAPGTAASYSRII